MKTVAFGVRVSPEEHDRLIQFSKQSGFKKTKLVEMAIKFYLDFLEKQQA